MNLAASVLAFILTSTMVYGQENYEVIIENIHNQVLYVETPDSKYVKFQGYIDQYSAFDIENVLSTTGSKQLRMNSYGGLAMTGYQLGFYIEENNIEVVIDEGSRCVSACAFAAIRSKTLKINNDGLMFHLPYTTQISIKETLEDFKKENDISLSLLIRYLREMNFTLDFIDLIVYGSDINKFIVIESVSDLEHFKSDDFLEEISIEGKYKIVEMP